MNKYFLLFLLIPVFMMGCSSSVETTDVSQSKALPEPDSMGASLLNQYCTSCHGAPQPGVHKQNEWRNVVYRMNVRRLKHAMDTIPDDEVDVLVEYMEKHSR